MAITKHQSTVALLTITLILVAVFIISLGVMTATASAQDVNITSGTETPTPEIGDRPISVSRTLLLHDAEYSADTGMARLTLHNTGDTRISVTITDAGAFMDGGEIPQRAITIDPGKETIEMPVTETPGGSAGVTIDAQNTLYAVPLERNNVLIGGPWTANDARLGAAFGAISVSLVSLVIVYRRLSGKGQEPERIA